MPEMEFGFHWGDETVHVYARSRQEAWDKLDKARYSSPFLSIDSLEWWGWRGGWACHSGININ
jgi:hypothetical protein